MDPDCSLHLHFGRQINFCSCGGFLSCCFFFFFSGSDCNFCVRRDERKITVSHWGQNVCSNLQFVCLHGRRKDYSWSLGRAANPFLINTHPLFIKNLNGRRPSQEPARRDFSSDILQNHLATLPSESLRVAPIAFFCKAVTDNSHAVC